MTQDSRPWTGTSTGDAGAYSASEWQQLYKYFIGVGGARANVGPFLGSGTQPNDGLKVTQHSSINTQVDVAPGSALVQGIEYLNDATASFTISGNASGNPRIDTVILRADYVAQTVRLVVLQGSPAASPTPLALTQTGGVTWEIPLADVAVANGFASITNANITPRHEWVNAAAGVYLDNVLNNSGGTLQTGDAVIWDTSADRAVTTTTTPNHALVAGTWVGRTANGGYGRVLRDGIGFVVTDGAYARGTGLSPSTTAKQVGGVSGLQAGTVGILLEASTGAGELHLAHINVQRRKNAIARYSQTLSSGTAGTAYANGDNIVALNTEDTDANNIGVLASNQVTLQPGLYHVHADISVTASATRAIRAFIYDITAGAIAITGVNMNTTTNTTTVASVSGYLLVTAPNVYELHVRFGAAAVNQPAALSSGSEVYAAIEFVRIDQ